MTWETIQIIILLIVIPILLKYFAPAIRRAGRNIFKKKNYTKNSNYHKTNTKSKTTYQEGYVWNENIQEWVDPSAENTNQSEDQKSQDNTKNNTIEEIDYKKAYQAKLLFTKNEWYAHRKLREIADVKGYTICPKVRLLDIVEPRKGEAKYKTLFYKIQAKHVDFVICDKDMHIKAIIELDDSSHDTTQRKERDEFVDMILRSVGYKVIHTRYINYDILDLV